MNYNPRLMKRIQELNRMSPDQRAIFNINAEAAIKGRDDIKQLIEGLNAEANQISQDTSRRSINKNYEYRKEDFENEQDLKPLAHTLGALSLGAGALEGFNRYRRQSNRADLYDSLLGSLTTD